MRDIKYTIVLEIETTSDSISDSDINTLLNGCKFLHINSYFLLLKIFVKKQLKKGN